MLLTHPIFTKCSELVSLTELNSKLSNLAISMTPHIREADVLSPLNFTLMLRMSLLNNRSSTNFARESHVLSGIKAKVGPTKSMVASTVNWWCRGFKALQELQFVLVLRHREVYGTCESWFLQHIHRIRSRSVLCGDQNLEDQYAVVHIPPFA